MEELIIKIGPYLAALIISMITYFITNIRQKTLAKKVQTLEDFLKEDDGEYYVICPNCQQKIYLRKIKIYIDKDGEEDGD